MSAEQKLKELGLVIPESSSPLGSYVPIHQVGDLVYLSGVLPKLANGEVLSGFAGADSVERGQQAARVALLNAMGVIKGFLGDLDKVGQVVRLVGYVQSETGFKEHPKVINGASDLLLEIFGEKGRHARSAVGVNSLPLGAFVELELTLAVNN